MQISEKKQDYQQLIWDFIGVAWRRKFWVFVPLVLSALIAVYYALSLPKIYQSSTLILVEAQKVPQNVVQSAVTGTAQDRLSTIKQQILSRSFLSRIIEEFSLYDGSEPSMQEKMSAKLMGTVGRKSKPLSSGEKVERIRKAIEVKTKGRKQLESFSISFMGRKPETVMNVTNELASLVIEENLRIRESFIEGATAFLQVELNNIKRELERQEKRFGDYKRTHLGELPEQLDSNLRALDRFQLNLENVRLGMKATTDRILDLETTYKTALNQQKQGITPIIASRPSLGVVAPTPLSPTEQKLLLFRESLSDLLVEYSETYPDVATLKGKIEALEEKLQKERVSALAARDRLTANDDVLTVRVEGRASELVLTPDVQSGPLLALLDRIRSVTEELRDLEKRQVKIKSQIVVYERRVENTPKREQEMITIRRDYDNVSKSYQALLAKKLNAEISENLEKRQKGEQFRIVDSANFPEKPIKPNKPLIVLMGTALGLGLGIGLAFIREQLDNSLRKPEEVERITSVLVLATIPDFDDEIKAQRKLVRRKVVEMEGFSGRKRKQKQGGGTQ